MNKRALSPVLIEPMTEGHADAVLSIYQSGIDEGNATFETEIRAWAAFSAAGFPSTGLSPPRAISFLAG